MCFRMPFSVQQAQVVRNSRWAVAASTGILLHPHTSAPTRLPLLQLCELRLASNALGDWGVAPLLEVLATGCCHLRWLDLSGCGVAEQSAPGLLAALDASRQLLVLKLGWSSLGLRGARALAAGLQANSCLRELHLPWSGIGDCGGWPGPGPGLVGESCVCRAACGCWQLW